jgi:twinkle protein
MAHETYQRNESTSTFVYHKNCEDCGSSDALSVYSDGHTHCFSCRLTKACKDTHLTAETKVLPKGLVDGEYVPLKARGINLETCKKFGYKVGEHNGHHVQIAPYYLKGKQIGQKIRGAHKKFTATGTMKGTELFGQHLWGEGGKRLVITEGEIDCLSVSQIQENKWAVVSLPLGATSAPKAIKNNLEWLETFETVVLCFDQDDAGAAAVEAVTPLFSPNKCAVASMPLKDANEMLLAGKGAELIQCLWRAKKFKPDGIVGVGDLMDRLTKPLEQGLSWAWQGLTDATYGIRSGELYVLGAGTGMGKSEIWKETMVHLAEHHKLNVGGLFLEESPEHTVRCLASKIKDKLFHVPSDTWTDEELITTVKGMEDSNRYHLYDHFGSTEYEVIKQRIRFMVVSLDCRHIFIDHITAMVSGTVEGDERKQLAYIMTDLASLARELKVSLFLISHLNTPEGKPHEEGGRVQIKHFFGSRAIGQWANFVIGIERNQQHKDEHLRHMSTIRILKDRYTGRSVGTCVYLDYDAATGRLVEIVDDPFASDNLFKDKGEF